MQFYRHGVFETGARLNWLDEQIVARRFPAGDELLSRPHRGGAGSARAAAAAPKGRGLLKFAVPAALFATLLLQLWVRVTIIYRGYEIETLRSATVRSDAELRRKRLELAYLARPDQLRSRAEKELAMRPTPPQHLRRITLNAAPASKLPTNNSVTE